jgi:hypothetical protein
LGAKPWLRPGLLVCVVVAAVCVAAVCVAAVVLRLLFVLLLLLVIPAKAGIQRLCSGCFSPASALLGPEKIESALQRVWQSHSLVARMTNRLAA